MRVSDFVINSFAAVKSQGREIKKYDFETIFFIFKYFKLLEIDKKILVSN